MAAKLIPTRVPDDPDGVVLVLHGGGSRRRMMVSPAQLSVLRMVPIAKRVALAGRGRLAVFRLLNSARGWDAHHTPVDDVHWALAQVAERLGVRPTCLVGHSLGGRAALLSLGAPGVVGAAALAPWVLPSDRPADAAGSRVLIVHGSRDRIADPRRSLALADALRGAAEVSYVCVEGGKHAMLRRHAVFDGYASRFAVETLLGDSNDATPLGAAPGERIVRV